MAATTPDMKMMFGGEAVTTFLGLPACPDIATTDADAVIVSAGCMTPYPWVGAYCAAAPAAIRAASGQDAAAIGHVDFDLGGPILGRDGKVVDAGDLPVREDDPAGNRDAMRSAVSAILSRGAVPIVIGGDDSTPIPMIEAFAGHGRFTIVQIDAHIDWRDEVRGERYGLSSTMRRASELAHVERIIQVGRRGIGSARPGDVEAARAFGVTFVSGRDVQRHGIGPVLDLVPAGSKVIICLDCDGLDPAIMPAVLAPTPGGLTYWHVLDLFAGISAKARIAGFDLVELVPERDVGGLGALTAYRLIANVIGHVVRARGA